MLFTLIGTRERSLSTDTVFPDQASRKHREYEIYCGFVFTLRWKMYTAEVISFDFMVPVRSLKVYLNEH